MNRLHGSAFITTLYTLTLLLTACHPTEPVVIGEYHTPTDTWENQ